MNSISMFYFQRVFNFLLITRTRYFLKLQIIIREAKSEDNLLWTIKHTTVKTLLMSC